MNGYSLPAALTALCTVLLNHDARSWMTANVLAAELAAMCQVVAGLCMQLHVVLIECSDANANESSLAIVIVVWAVFNVAIDFDFLSECIPDVEGHIMTKEPKHTVYEVLWDAVEPVQTCKHRIKL
jgi:hypothetical protein